MSICVKQQNQRPPPRCGLAPGSLIALNGEAGYQADTLAPGWHFGFWLWQFTVLKGPVVLPPQGEIGLVVAAEQGVSIAELHAHAQIKQATGEAKAEAEAYTALQVMQIVGDQRVRVVPDVSVTRPPSGRIKTGPSSPRCVAAGRRVVSVLRPAGCVTIHS